MIVDGIEVKTIPGFSNYAITKDGRVWSFPREGSSTFGMWRSFYIDNHDYKIVDLWLDGSRFHKKIHRLVLETYAGPCPPGMECRHLDGNKQNNRLENLIWGTKKENRKDSREHGVLPLGEKCGTSKLKEENVRMIIYTYRTGLFSQREIAEMYNLNQSSVYDIVNKKSWKHLWTKVA